MAEGEEPSSEQAGGATPPQQPPELGVPSYGGPSPGGQGAGAPPTGTPPPSSTPPPAGQPSQPEIIEDYHPMVQPAKPTPPPRQRRGLGISRIVAIGIILLIGLGWVVTQVRHAHATANDKAACSSTLAALSTPATIPTMVHDLNFSDDKTLLGIAGGYATDHPLGRIVAGRCRQAGVPLVKLGIVDDGTPNAFTFGHTRGDARIWVTRGLLERLDERELDAVLTHEIGHVKNRDFIVMTVAAVVPMVLYLIWVVGRTGRDQARYVAIAAYIGWIISRFTLLALSRARVYAVERWSCHA